MSTFVLSVEQYEALISMARVSTVGDAQRTVQLELFLKDIEASNGIERSFLLVQWQERSATLPQGTKFPTIWPPQLRKAIELISRPIAKVDVEAVLNRYASEPMSVLVTRDPAGLVGWTPIDSFFIT